MILTLGFGEVSTTFHNKNLLSHAVSVTKITLRIRYTKVSRLSTMPVSHQSLVGPFVCCLSVCQLSPCLSSVSVFLSARWSVGG